MGFKRSRALWDHARRSSHSSTWDKKIAGWGRAILYELQPVRFSALKSSIPDLHSWNRTAQTLLQSAWKFATVTLPWLARSFFQIVRNLRLRQWLWLMAAVAYYFLLRWVHDILHAGPFVLMVTALVGIFTVGLGDTAGDGFSAYSVFNRGFERLLGSIDADELLAQHVGGGGMGMMMMMGQQQQQQQRGQDAPPPQNGAGRAPQHVPAPGENNRRNNNPNANDENPHEEADEQQQRVNNNKNNRSRKSNKKARRRNQEQRQEMRRQREAAAAMGFAGNEQDQAAAMNRLIEDQVAANQDPRPDQE